MQTYHDFLNDLDRLHDLFEMTTESDFLKFAKKIADKKQYDDKDKRKTIKKVQKMIPKLDDKQIKILKTIFKLKKIPFPKG